MSHNKNEDRIVPYYTENEDISNLKKEIEKIQGKIKNICLVEDTSIREDIVELSKKLDNVISKYNSKVT